MSCSRGKGVEKRKKKVVLVADAEREKGMKIVCSGVVKPKKNCGPSGEEAVRILRRERAPLPSEWWISLPPTESSKKKGGRGFVCDGERKRKKNSQL